MSYQFESISDVPEGLGEGLTNFLLEVKSVIDLALSRTDINYTPELDYEFANKKYVDDTIQASGSVTGGDSHDHAGGDGAPISHGNLTNKGSYSHGQIDTHINSPNPHNGSLGNPVLDNEYINFGNGPDARIGFNGNDLVIQTATGAETFAEFHGATLGISLYHNNAISLETTATGVRISNGLATHGIDIFFSGEHAYFQNDDASGNIYIRGRNSADTSYNLILFGNPDAGTNLYYDGTAVLQTAAAGITISDGVAVGASLFYAADDFYLSNFDPDGAVVLTGRNTLDTASHVLLYGNPNGGTALYYNNLLAFATTISGINIYDTDGNSANLDFYDSTPTFRGRLTLSGNDFYVQLGASFETAIKANINGTVELYYDNAVRFITQTAGVFITDGIADGCSIYFSADDLYIDNNDPDGFVYIRARNSLDTINCILMAGDPDSSTSLYYNNSLRIATGVEGLRVFSSNAQEFLIERSGSAFQMISKEPSWPMYWKGRNALDTADNTILYGDPEGQTQIFYNGILAFHSASVGISVYDTDGSSPYVQFRDNLGNLLGQVGIAANDIYLDAGRNIAGGGQVYLRGWSGAVYDTLLMGNQGADVRLMYNAVEAFRTTADGIRVADTNGDLPTIEFYEDDLVTRNALISAGTELQIQNDQTDGNIGLYTNNGTFQELMIYCSGGAGVGLYYHGTLTAAVGASSIYIYGTASYYARMTHNANDVEIYNNRPGGDIILRARNAADTANYTLFRADPNGAGQLYYNAQIAMVTRDDGIVVGNTSEGEFYHTGSAMYLESRDAVNLTLRHSTVSTPETMAVFNANGGVDLYYNNNRIVYTTATGIRAGVSPFDILDSANNNAIKITTAAQVELRYNGNKKAETFSEGLAISQILKLLERTSDPTKPSEGEAVIWMSDGTGLGADGDILIGVTAGAATKYAIIYVHATATTWV